MPGYVDSSICGMFQDGIIHSDEDDLLLDLSPGQLAGVIVGLVVFISVLMVTVYLVARRCRERCRLVRLPQKDAQILVIEAQEEVDSDGAEST